MRELNPEKVKSQSTYKTDGKFYALCVNESKRLLYAGSSDYSVHVLDSSGDQKEVLETTKNRLLKWLELPSVQQGKTKLKMRKKISKRMKSNIEKDTNEIVEIWFNESGRYILGKLVKKLMFK